MKTPNFDTNKTEEDTIKQKCPGDTCRKIDDQISHEKNFKQRPSVFILVYNNIILVYYTMYNMISISQSVEYFC